MKYFVIAILLVLMPISGYAQPFPPNWQTYVGTDWGLPDCWPLSQDCVDGSEKPQQLPPNWQTAPQPLLDPNTHAPFDLTDNERSVIVKCLTLMNRPTNDHFYYATLDHIARYEPLIIGDMLFINGPLMEAQRTDYGLSDEEIATIKPLLRRLRKAVSEAIRGK